MIKNILKVLFLLLLTTQISNAYEDVVIFCPGKITNINIEDNSIIDVQPIVTIENKKDTLIVHPRNIGRTRFCALKNNKNLSLFEVLVTEYGTHINAPNGYETLSIDPPAEFFEYSLDEPPMLR